jgi:hypothetical protein
MNLRIDIRDSATPALKSTISLFSGARRRELNEAMGQEVQHLTADYIAELAASRHDTARKLGAMPTNHLAQASEKVASPAALTSDAEGATLTIDHPGFGRAFHDVTIVPTNVAALTIPISAAAYGRRAREFAGLFRIKGTNVLALAVNGGVVPMFALVRSVTQPQDRTLLPSMEQFQEAAVRGAEQYRQDYKRALSKGGNL